ncbi:hypothetical protein AVEN_20373-1 [Araneus ventricosus]|uniref:Transposase Tc1-like domain-containing protein n=1 Tax=Araneus ventricosus TaxID=182803 RepID=A0A4Y2FV68_ARAVE|nr:hypothetical protein AVEN_20373-1 [Araneus ventricosus]
MLLKHTMSFKYLRTEIDRKDLRNLTTCMKGNIMGKVRDNPRISSPQIAADLKADYNIEVTPQTARNVITKAGYNGRAASKKPCINLCNGESASSLQRSI